MWGLLRQRSAYASYSKDKIIEFGVGALLHDLGKAVVGYHVVNKETSHKR